ncbi:Major facilitator superfamily protein [Hibiscus syriacus]|uniref:Major facilitator superfamily protein n=1 Tax=Hibiscus syriacus TaxID=106335 RepID=A0A6A2WRB3_HIBSY|nr:protein NUCLEAR FUSION DEFECTIVE 4-like [Hibiscus syriacus]KAE8656880.1 Major facilitator superfamily protein [Hibiscus syriacus]
MPGTFLQWLSLVAIIWLQSINGTNTNFPAYSSQLKHLLSISQIQLNNLAFASDAGKLLGWISGIAANYLPMWLVLILGSALGLIGYGVQYLFLIGRVSNLSYGAIFFLTVLEGNSICWINTVCYIVTIKNFPLDRQLAIGLTGSYLGLSAKIYTDIVDVFPYSAMEKAKAYLLLSSVLPFAVSVVSAPVVRVINVVKTKRAKSAFILILVITTATGAFSVVGSLGSASSELSPLTSAVGMAALLVAPLLIPLGLGLRLQTKQLIPARILNRLNPEEKVHVEEFNNVSMDIMESGTKEIRESISISSISVELSESCSGDDNVSETNDIISVLEEIGVKVMLRRLSFWLYFFVYLFGVTLGLVFFNNLGQIAESRGCQASALVSLSSSFGFFGRLVPSVVDYFFSRSKYMISRTAFVVALMVPTGSAFFLLLVNDSGELWLYISTAIIGVCTGAITSISVSLTTELFGTKNFGVNHNVVVANIPIGSFLFGYLAAIVYRREGNAEGKCFGMECYRKTFVLWGTLCFIGTFLALILYGRTRKFYNSLRS